MKERILVTSTDVMMLQFLVPHIFYLLENGYDIEVACSNVEGHIDELKDIFGSKVKMHLVDLKRSPMELSNFRGLHQLKKIIKDGGFNIVWTNEPVMGIMTRLAARLSCGRKIKILYIAHGFHFYKGASKKNWLLFFPIEKVFSYFTDEIVTINNEDFEFAKKHFKTSKIVKFPGIGIKTQKFFKTIDSETIKKTRRELGVLDGEKIILSVGELEKRKNHETSIRAFQAANIEKAKLFICGVGTQEENLKALIAELGLQKSVVLLGYRTDISELCHCADVFLFTTFQEGLSVALMEAMSVGMPCIVSKIRGNIDLIEENKGIYCNPYDVYSCEKALREFFDNPDCLKSAIKYNQNKVKKFDFENVKELLVGELKEL
jgi:glycosyltransferase EpsD